MVPVHDGLLSNGSTARASICIWLLLADSPLLDSYSFLAFGGSYVPHYSFYPALLGKGCGMQSHVVLLSVTLSTLEDFGLLTSVGISCHASNTLHITQLLMEHR